MTALALILEQVARDWSNLPGKETITEQWWIEFCGYVPEDPSVLPDVELLVLSVVALRNELEQYRTGVA
jgi:hypothetical protein